jgi:Putative prokaryotic signal transducing protein
MDTEWRVLATFASGLEADIAIARLEEAEIPALRDSHDGAGIFGFGFQGATSRGVTVRVPAAALDDALALLDDDTPMEPHVEG